MEVTDSQESDPGLVPGEPGAPCPEEPPGGRGPAGSGPEPGCLPESPGSPSPSAHRPLGPSPAVRREQRLPRNLAQEKGGRGGAGGPHHAPNPDPRPEPSRGAGRTGETCCVRGVRGAGRSYGHLRAPALRAPRPRAAAPGGGTEPAHPGKAERGTRGVRRGSPTGPLALRDRSRLCTFFPSGETSGRSTREAQRGRAPRWGESLGGYGVLSPGACGGAGRGPNREGRRAGEPGLSGNRGRGARGAGRCLGAVQGRAWIRRG